MLHPPSKDKIRETIIFRNDDVAADTNLEHFREFCELFHRYGFVQLHGITLYGKVNDTLIVDDIPWMYEEITPDEIFVYEKCVKVSTDYIGDNKGLIEYLNAIPDPLALHGLYHSDYSQMTYEQQEHDIQEGLRLLNILFPNKKIDTFIAPFNHVNDATYEICRKYGLKISALEGEHLEDRLDNGKGPIYEGELYRYHHHRFYPESTYYYYDLSIEKLDAYLKKFSYTINPKNGRIMPSESLARACYQYYGIEPAFDEKEMVEEAVELNVLKYVENDKSVLVLNAVNNSLVHRLWRDGYSNIIGIDDENERVDATNLISKLIGSEVCIYSQELKELSGIDKVFAIVFWDNGENGSVEELFDYGARLLEEQGAFFVVTSSEKENLIIDLASQVNARLINCKPYSQNGKDAVYVFVRQKPRVCFYCDRPNWAHDNSARVIKRYLSDEFDINIRYVIEHEDYMVNEYDAFLVFFWGEKSYQKERYSKSRIIKQVSSHRWQFDKPYGPISVEEFHERYLNDADTVICPSKILYDILAPQVRNIFLCGKGYDSELFYCENKRQGPMSLCMVGNLTDPVKGVEDLLMPAADGYQLDLAKDIKHDELRKFYNVHDIYVVSSVHEADPLPLIESMACGCFPVASRIGIAPELIRHKENGYLVEKRTVEEFQKAFAWCENNLEYIRERAPLIANELKQTRDWEIMSENYRKMLRNHIGRR